MQSQERRNAPRWEIKRQGRLNFINQLSWDECKLEDLNLKGMKISFQKSLPYYLEGKMSLVLDDGFALRVETKTCWEAQENGRYAYGIIFTRIWEEDKERVFQYYRENYPQEFNKNLWEG